VFIALATLVTARFLHFPRKHLEDPHAEVVARRIVFGVVILTLLPSIYFGYDIIQQNRFRRRADRFVDSEAIFPNDYLLDKTIDGKAKAITLTYGGEPIQENVIDELRSKLGKYQLDGAKLEIKQGFAILNRSEKDDKKSQQINTVLNEKEKELNALREKVAATETEKKESVAAIDAEKALSKQIFDELKAQYPSISSCTVQRVFSNDGSEQIPVWTAIITSTSKLKQSDRNRIEKFLKARVKTQQMLLTFEVAIVSTTHQSKINAYILIVRSADLK
jgi:hypothetical protein